MDELRNTIFDHLFRASSSLSLDELASQLNQDPIAVRAAVEHTWFVLEHDRVAIAYQRQ